MLKPLYILAMNKELSRCGWVNPKNPLDITYHDEEWCGAQVHDERLLFELLCLEGAQAGLSWSTVLKKRAAYKAVFDNFRPEKVALYGEEKLQELLKNEGLIRNGSKLRSHIHNAQCFLAVQKEFGSFGSFFWSFTDGKTLTNTEKTWKDVPAQTALSEEISKALKKRGFSFVGPTIIYAYMQATGMVNDHAQECFKRKNPA